MPTDAITVFSIEDRFSSPLMADLPELPGEFLLNTIVTTEFDILSEWRVINCH